MTQACHWLVAVLVFIGTWTVPGESKVTLVRYPEIRVAQARAKGSSARYTCLGAVNRNRDRAEVQCSGRRGRALARAVLVRVSDGTTLVSASVSGRSFAVSLAAPTAAAVNALLEGDLRVRLLSRAGLEAQGTFQTPRRGLTWVHYRLSAATSLRQTRQVQTDGFTYYEGDASIAISRNPNIVAVDAVTRGFTPTDWQLSRNGQPLVQSNDGIFDDGVFFLGTITRNVANQLASLPTDFDMLGTPGGQVLGPSGDCFRNSETHCLADHRFEVILDWRDFDGKRGEGQRLEQLGPPDLQDDAGLFYFFNPSNVDLLVQLVDSCEKNGRWWFFASGATDVEFDLTVTDTQTNQSRTYSNPLGTPFEQS